MMTAVKHGTNTSVNEMRVIQFSLISLLQSFTAIPTQVLSVQAEVDRTTQFVLVEVVNDYI